MYSANEVHEFGAQILFGLLIFVIPAVLAFFVWQGTRVDRQTEKDRGQNLLLFSAVALSCNILLLYGWYVTNLLVVRERSISQANISEYKFLLATLWVSRIAFLMSLATLITALFSRRGSARKLCIWGSAAGLIWWPLVNLGNSELLAAYLRHHR
jgi:hypothetical protein